MLDGQCRSFAATCRRFGELRRFLLNLLSNSFRSLVVIGAMGAVPTHTSLRLLAIVALPIGYVQRFLGGNDRSGGATAQLLNPRTYYLWPRGA